MVSRWGLLHRDAAFGASNDVSGVSRRTSTLAISPPACFHPPPADPLPPPPAAASARQSASAELWYVDTDRAALESAPTTNTILLPKDGQEHSGPSARVEGQGLLAPADLARLVGRAASDAGGRGNINAGTDGAVTFVLAPAAAAPGGAATVLQVVGALRAAGHFTVAAVTQPFGFEGAAKQEQVGKQGGVGAVDCS